jgi:hypothetical protein
MSEPAIVTTDPVRPGEQAHVGSVTRERLITEGDCDMAVTDFSSWAGASSEAHPSKGVPSANMQRTGRQLSTEHTQETTRAGRAEPMRQNVEP